MKLELIRTYFPDGTNGTISFNGTVLCYSIELPWHNNQPSISCVPEGTYELIKRYSPKHKWHLQLNDVPDRQLILIHAANDAMKELKGCIAPVSLLTAEGKGTGSRKALNKITSLLFPAIDNKQTIFLTIKS